MIFEFFKRPSNSVQINERKRRTFLLITSSIVVLIRSKTPPELLQNAAFF